jgi:hypothetical protein
VSNGSDCKHNESKLTGNRQGPTGATVAPSWRGGTAIPPTRSAIDRTR